MADWEEFFGLNLFQKSWSLPLLASGQSLVLFNENSKIKNDPQQPNTGMLKEGCDHGGKATKCPSFKIKSDDTKKYSLKLTFVQAFNF